MGVPGEVAGYWEAKARYGSPELSWARLLRPTLDLLRAGVPVSATLAEKLATRSFTDPAMISVFVNPETGAVWGEGDSYTNPALYDTLQLLAEAGDAGAELFYRGEVAASLAADILELGGNITAADLAAYTAEWMAPVTGSLAQDTRASKEGSRRFHNHRPTMAFS